MSVEEDRVHMLSNTQKEIYSHSIALDEIKEIGQEKLLNSKVAVIGCGGLASSCLIYLVSIGVGHISIIDDDVIEISNLPRQILFNVSDAGKYKVEAAKEKLAKQNKDVSIDIYKTRLSKDNAIELLQGHDVVLDCTDNFESKFLINDICLQLNIPFVIAGVSDYQGQVTTVIPYKSQDFKSIFSIIPKSSDVDPVEKLKVFPLAVGVVSDIAAMEVIKVLLNIGELLTDKMLVVNILNNHYQIIKFPK